MPLRKLVVDTDVASFIFKQHPFGERYKPHLRDSVQVLSFQTVAELERWSLSRNWGERRKSQLEGYMNDFLIYPYSRALCSMWATVVHGAERNGRPIMAADAWVAAVALIQGIPLVTHNRADYLGVPELMLISEA